LFTALVAYQYGDTAVQMAEQLFPAVRNSEKLIPGAEIHFAEVVFAGRLEQAYAARGERTGWTALNQAVGPFGFDIEPDLAREIDTLWSYGFTVEDRVHRLARDFSRGLLLLGFGFGRAMRERKGTGFPCALLMWWQFRRRMLEQAEQNEGNSLDFSAKALQEMVVKQLGLRFLGLSSRKTHAVILLWGLPYVYDYLYSLGLVSEGLHSGMMDKVKWVKELLLKGIGARPVAA